MPSIKVELLRRYRGALAAISAVLHMLAIVYEQVHPQVSEMIPMAKSLVSGAIVISQNPNSRLK